MYNSLSLMIKFKRDDEEEMRIREKGGKPMRLNEPFEYLADNGTLEKKKLMIRNIEEKIPYYENSSDEKKLKDLFVSYFKLARLYLSYTDGFVLDRDRGLHYSEMVLQDTRASFNDKLNIIVWVGNMFWREGNSEKAAEILGWWEGEVEVAFNQPNMISKKTAFSYYWLLAVCHEKQLGKFRRYTELARYCFNGLQRPKETLVDKAIRTGLWLGYQGYIQSKIARWKKNKGKKSNELFKGSEGILKSILNSCRDHNSKWEVYALLHLAVLYTFIRKNLDEAIKMLEEVEAISRFEGLEESRLENIQTLIKIIRFRIKIEMGEDPGKFGELELKENFLEDGYLGFLVFDTALEMLEKNYQLEQNQIFISSIIKNHKKMYLPEELESLRELVIQKIVVAA